MIMAPFLQCLHLMIRLTLFMILDASTANKLFPELYKEMSPSTHYICIYETSVDSEAVKDPCVKYL